MGAPSGARRQLSAAKNREREEMMLPDTENRKRLLDISPCWVSAS